MGSYDGESGGDDGDHDEDDDGDDGDGDGASWWLLMMARVVVMWGKVSVDGTPRRHQSPYGQNCTTSTQSSSIPFISIQTNIVGVFLF